MRRASKQGLSSLLPSCAQLPHAPQEHRRPTHALTTVAHTPHQAQRRPCASPPTRRPIHTHNTQHTNHTHASTHTNTQHTHTRVRAHTHHTHTTHSTQSTHSTHAPLTCGQHAHDKGEEAGGGGQGAVEEDAAQKGAEEAVDDGLGEALGLRVGMQVESAGGKKARVERKRGGAAQVGSAGGREGSSRRQSGNPAAPRLSLLPGLLIPTLPAEGRRTHSHSLPLGPPGPQIMICTTPGAAARCWSLAP